MFSPDGTLISAFAAPHCGATTIITTTATTITYYFSFLFCSFVSFCLYDPFNCISFHQFSRQLSVFWLCSSGLMSALLVLSTVYLFMKVSFSPDIIPSGWLGSKHQLTNEVSFWDNPVWTTGRWNPSCYNGYPQYGTADTNKVWTLRGKVGAVLVCASFCLPDAATGRIYACVMAASRVPSTYLLTCYQRGCPCWQSDHTKTSWPS